jgi:type IV secretory pathway VirB10-like protein
VDQETPDDNQTPLVLGEIPSAVRSESRWNTLALLAFAAVGLGLIALLKGGSRKPAEPSMDTMASTNSGATPMPQMPSQLPAIATFASPASLQKADFQSLRDVRRKSPVLIYNNAGNPGTGAGTSLADPAAPTVPMPPGFHPSTAAKARSSALGDREFIIAQGKLIDAVLESAVNTDQPGMLRALVSEDIYGDTGRTVLLPRGSRLIGQYDSSAAQGQSRVFIIWQRVIRPDGIDITLDSGGTDPLGQAGVEGNVNRHFFTMFGAATLLSIIGAASATVGVGAQDANNSLSTYRSSVSQGFNEAANNVMGVFVRIKPTITIHPGTAVKVFVARDLYFDPAAVAGNRVQVIP